MPTSFLSVILIVYFLHKPFYKFCYNLHIKEHLFIHNFLLIYKYTPSMLWQGGGSNTCLYQESRALEFMNIF